MPFTSLALLLLAPPQEPPLTSLLPREALAVLEVPDPGRTLDRLRRSAPWKAFEEGRLAAGLRKAPPYALVQAGWTSILRASGAADLRDLVESSLGGGLVAALLPPAGGEEQPGAVLAFRSLSPEITQSAFEALLRLLPGEDPLLAGETWSLPLGERARAERRGATFLIYAPPAAGAVLATDAGASIAARASWRAERRALGGRDAWMWLDRRLLEADGPIPEKPEDAGVSFLFGAAHEALRRAEHATLALDLDPATWSLEARIPAPEDLARSHAPWFPSVREARLPAGPEILGSWVIPRDLGTWWTSRDRWMNAAALADTVETDGSFSLLFARDFGPEVLHHLEPLTRVVFARIPDPGGLELEFPGLAVGWRMREDAPEDLAEGFATAFLAAVTFTKFDGGMAAEETLQMDSRTLADGTRLYLTSYRNRGGEDLLPARFQLTPALAVLPDGQIWLATNARLLQEMLEGPWVEEPVRGERLVLGVPAGLPILEHDREALIAGRALKEGGDVEAAEAFVEEVESALRLLQALVARQELRGDRLEITLELHFTPAGDED